MKTPSPKLEIFAKTIIGMVRDHNEDNLLVGSDWQQGNWQTKETWENCGAQAPFPNPPGGVLMLVADGMGGANAGEVASQIAVDAFQEHFGQLARKKASLAPTDEILKSGILYAHKRIVEYAKQNTATKGMGTTVVAAWIHGQTATIAWSGDSRAYLYREAEGLHQLSKDHSYVQSLVDAGQLTPDQAAYHPQSNVILQSLGDTRQPPEPSTRKINLLQGDYLLLCSDGLNGMITDKEISDIIASQTADNLEEVVRALVRSANEAGGHDNISVVAAYVHEAETYIPPLPELEPKPGRKKFMLALLIILAALLGVAGSWWFVENTVKRDEGETPPVGKADSSRTHPPSTKEADEGNQVNPTDNGSKSSQEKGVPPKPKVDKEAKDGGNGRKSSGSPAKEVPILTPIEEESTIRDTAKKEHGGDGLQPEVFQQNIPKMKEKKEAELKNKKADLEKKETELSNPNPSQKKQNKRLRDEIDKLKKEIEKLETELNKVGQN
jgi:serine/threonine protein phosphatase PrpC